MTFSPHVIGYVLAIAITAWFTSHAAYQQGANGVIVVRNQLEQCISKSKTLKEAIDNQNKQIQRGKEQLDALERAAKVHNIEAAHGLSTASEQAQKVLQIPPGDDYTEASLRVIRESLKK